MGSLTVASAPPVVASIVLLDVFDKPKAQPQPHIPSFSTPSTPSSSCRAARTPASSQPPSSPHTHGVSTPQKSFDISQTEDEEDTYEIFGGGALYALVGARMWLPSTKVRTLVNRKTTMTNGSSSKEKPELADEHEALLKQFGDISIINEESAARGSSGRLEQEDNATQAQGMWVFKEGPDMRLARARIRYEGDIRLYQHIVKTPHRSFAELRASPLRNAEYLHIAPPFSSENLHTLLEEIKTVNQSLKEEEKWYPKILFEPTPPSCHAAQREWAEKIYSGIEVFSPNHEELLSLYADHPALTSAAAVATAVDSEDSEGEEQSVPRALKAQVEVLIHHILDLGIGRNGDGAVAIRCSKHGCAIGTRQGGVRWFPAFYGAEDSEMVRDVTGAGNSFIGGFAAGLHLSGGDPYKAALYGTVSSSFIVEQIGLPTILAPTDGQETWNGSSPLDRLRAFEGSLGSSS